GMLEITDFMPMAERAGEPSRIIRIVRGLRGKVPVRMECRPAFNYGRDDCAARIEENGTTAVFTAQPDRTYAVRLYSSRPMDMDSDQKGAHARFTLKTGETVVFVLSCNGESGPDFSSVHAEELYNKTVAYWQDWAKKIIYEGRWHDMVHRSALLLK